MTDPVLAISTMPKQVKGRDLNLVESDLTMAGGEAKNTATKKDMAPGKATAQGLKRKRVVDSSDEDNLVEDIHQPSKRTSRTKGGKSSPKRKAATHRLQTRVWRRGPDSA